MQINSKLFKTWKITYVNHKKNYLSEAQRFASNLPAFKFTYENCIFLIIFILFTYEITYENRIF